MIQGTVQTRRPFVDLSVIMDRYCRLCRALSSLPEIQARRIEARYLLGMGIKEIAEAENTGERNIRKSISRGLAAMRKFY